MNGILTHTRMTTENNTGLSAANNLQIKESYATKLKRSSIYPLTSINQFRYNNCPCKVVRQVNIKIIFKT